MALPDVRRVVTAYDTNGISVFDTDQAIGKVAPPAGSSATQFSVRYIYPSWKANKYT